MYTPSTFYMISAVHILIEVQGATRPSSNTVTLILYVSLFIFSSLSLFSFTPSFPLYPLAPQDVEIFIYSFEHIGNLIKVLLDKFIKKYLRRRIVHIFLL